MTEPVDWTRSDMVEALEARLAEAEDKEQRRRDFAVRADGIPGPLGDLLRTVSTAYVEWVDAYEMRATTEAESIRMEQIVDAAVVFERWLSGVE